MNEQAYTRLVHQEYQSVKAGDFESFLECAGRRCPVATARNGKCAICRAWHGREQFRPILSKVAQAQDVIELSRRTLSRKTQSGCCWIVSLRASSLPAEFPASGVCACLDRQRWQSNHFREYVRHRRRGKAHTAAQSGYGLERKADSSSGKGLSSSADAGLGDRRTSSFRRLTGGTE